MAHRAYFSTNLITHGNMVFHGHFVHAMPLLCACLVVCHASLEILFEGCEGTVALAILAMFPWGCEGTVAVVIVL